VISIAAGTVPELAPQDLVQVAATAGWPATGIWCDPLTWTDATAVAVRRRLDDTGLVALDLEPVIVSTEGDAGELQIDAAAAVGARHVLVVCRDLEPAAFAERFDELCDLAQARSLVCALEFLPIMSLGTLEDALAVIERVDRPNAAILVDNLHLDRSGGSPGDLALIDPALLPYAQVCDAPAVPADDRIYDARLGRLNIGEGDLAVERFVAALPPTTDLSAEIRSQRLYDRFPDPLNRARAVLAATRPLDSGLR